MSRTAATCSLLGGMLLGAFAGLVTDSAVATFAGSLILVAGCGLLAIGVRLAD